MKKILAFSLAIFTAAALTGCNKPADGLIDEITDAGAAENSEIYNAPRPAQQEDMLGAWISNNNLYFFVPDNIYEATGCKISALNAVMKNGKLDFGEAFDDGNMLLFDNTVYVNSDSEPTVQVLVYELYEPKLLEANDLDGHCQIYKNNVMLGEMSLENGKGTIHGIDKEITAEFYVNYDKITMTIDGEPNEYNYYVIDKKSAPKPNSAFTAMSAFTDTCTYIYLINDNEFFAIKKY